MDVGHAKGTDVPSVPTRLALRLQGSRTTPRGDVCSHIGEAATVTGKVERANQAKASNIFLSMGGKHPNETVAFPSTPAAS